MREATPPAGRLKDNWASSCHQNAELGAPQTAILVLQHDAELMLSRGQFGVDNLDPFRGDEAREPLISD